MFGALHSGKTTYLTVLIHEMERLAVSQPGVSFFSLDDQTSGRYRIFFKEPLFDNLRILPATVSTEGLTPTDPLIYRLSLGKGSYATLVFFDAAGEDMAEKSRRERYEPYLRVADGVIFIVDPAEIEGSSGDVAISEPSAAVAGPAGDEAVVRLGGLRQEALPERDIPAALVLSKIDALADNLARNLVMMRLPGATGALDEADRAAVHDEVRALLDRWKSGLPDLVTSHFSRSSFFAVSALGSPPREERVDPAGVRPHRVTDPLIWLLAEFGLWERS